MLSKSHCADIFNSVCQVKDGLWFTDNPKLVADAIARAVLMRVENDIIDMLPESEFAKGMKRITEIQEERRRKYRDMVVMARPPVVQDERSDQAIEDERKNKELIKQRYMARAIHRDSVEERRERLRMARELAYKQIDQMPGESYGTR